MPKGGWRPNSGRPTKEAAAAKAKLLTETIKRGPQTLPREYLQALLDSPGSSKSERLRAAELLLKLTPDAPAPSAPSSMPPIVLAVPRGCFLSEEQAADPEQLIPHGVPIEPFTATHDWTKSARASANKPASVEPECKPFEVAEGEVTQNVTRLDTFVRKRDSDEGQGPDVLTPDH